MSHLFYHFLTGKVTRPISEVALECSETYAMAKQVPYDRLLTCCLVL